MNQINNVAIYLRLSREQGDTLDSLFIHRKTLIEYCEKNDYSYDIYEEVSSGMNDEREQLDSLLSRLDLYDAIVCMDLDRLTRNDEFAMKIKSILIFNEIVILTPSATYNLAEENADLLYSIKSLLSNQEYKTIRKRLTRGRFAHAKLGLWMVNKVPFGYIKNDDKRLVINENEAPTIRLIFQRLSEGYSVHAITIELDKLGLKSRNGTSFTSSHVSQIRKNPVYYGVVQYKYKNEYKKVVDSSFVENAHEGIISKEEWLNVQQTSHLYKGVIQKSKAKTPLHHLIYCAKCKRKRFINVDNTKTFFIKSCGNKLSGDQCDDVGMKLQPVEDLVINRVKQLKVDLLEQIERYKSNDNSQEVGDINSELDMIQRQLDKLSKRMNGIRTMRADGELNKNEYADMMEKVENDRNKLTERQSMLDMKLNKLSNTENEIERVMDTINKIDLIDKLPVEEVNAFLHTIINKVYFARNISSKENKGRNNRSNDIEVTLQIEWK